MRNKVVVFPFDGVALFHLNGHRRKLKITHGNLSDGRCNQRCNRFSWCVVIAWAGRTPRATEECATDDDRKPADAEQPNPQCSLAGTRPVSFLLSRSIHVCTSFVASQSILPESCWLDLVCSLRPARRPAVTRFPPAHLSKPFLGLICPMKPATFSHVPNERRKLADRFQEDSSIPRSWCLG